MEPILDGNFADTIPPNRTHKIDDLAGCETADDRGKIVKQYFDRKLDVITEQNDDSRAEPANFTIPIAGDMVQADLNGVDHYSWFIVQADVEIYSTAFPRVFSPHMLDFEFSLTRSGETLKFVGLDVTPRTAFIAEITGCNGYIYTFKEAADNGRTGKCYHAANLKNLQVPQKALVKPVRHFDLTTGRCFEYVFEFLETDEVFTGGSPKDLSKGLYDEPDEEGWDISKANGKGVVVDITRRAYYAWAAPKGGGECKPLIEMRRRCTFDSTGRLYDVEDERYYCISPLHARPANTELW